MNIKFSMEQSHYITLLSFVDSLLTWNSLKFLLISNSCDLWKRFASWKSGCLVLIYANSIATKFCTWNKQINIKIHSQEIIKRNLIVQKKINNYALLLQKGIHCQHDFNTQIVYTLQPTCHLRKPYLTLSQ